MTDFREVPSGQASTPTPLPTPTPPGSRLPKPPYDDALLAELAQRLRPAQVHFRRDATTHTGAGRTAPDGGDRAGATSGHALDVEFLRQDARTLAAIEEALARMDGRKGPAYGLCRACTDTPQHRCATCPWIPPERLLSVPWAEYCVPMQELLDGDATEEQGGAAPAAQPAERRARVKRRKHHVRALDRAMQQAYVWIDKVMDRLQCDDREHAYRAVRGTLHALRDRLPPAEAAHLAAQLPLILRGIFYEGWRPGAPPDPARRRDGFLADVAAGLPVPPHPPEEMAKAVFATLEETVSTGEIAEVRHALPRPVRALWS